MENHHVYHFSWENWRKNGHWQQKTVSLPVDVTGHPSFKARAGPGTTLSNGGPNLLHYKTIQEIELQRELEDLLGRSCCWKRDFERILRF